MLKNLPVSRKIAAVIAAPLLMLLALAAIGIRDRLAEADTAGDIEILAELATAGGPALRDVVIEQTAAEEAALGQGTVEFESRLRFTDRSLGEFEETIAAATDLAVAQGFKQRLIHARAEVASVSTIRALVLEGDAPVQQVRIGYTDLATSIEHVVNGAGVEASVLRRDAESKVQWYAIGAAIGAIAAVLMAWLVARSITRPLARLTSAADQLASERLPALVDGLRSPGSLNSDAFRSRPIDVESDDEIGQVTRALNAVQSTTIDVAEQQAELVQRGIGDIFVSLARRNQALLDRQIEFIDQLEARETDADRLDQLFKLDHLATRMRRNAESLLVLANATPSRRKLDPVPLSRVVRVAIGEVEEFARVQVVALDDLAVAGNAAVDIAHLLAELMDNASQYSAPDTTVEVVGHAASGGAGYVIAIRDHGIGMSADQIEAANLLLADPPAAGLSSSGSLGFNVVGRIAERFGLVVRLRQPDEGGVTALVTVPDALLSAIPPLTDPVLATTPVARPRPEARNDPRRVPAAAPTVIQPTEDRPLLDQDAPAVPRTPAGLPRRQPGASGAGEQSPAPGRRDRPSTGPTGPVIAAAAATVGAAAPADAPPSRSADGDPPREDDRVGDGAGSPERVPVGPPSGVVGERSSLGLVKRIPGQGLAGVDPRVSAATRTRVAATRRSPEEVRAMLSRYRSGLDEGRSRPDESPDAPDEPPAQEDTR